MRHPAVAKPEEMSVLNFDTEIATCKGTCSYRLNKSQGMEL